MRWELLGILEESGGTTIMEEWRISEAESSLTTIGCSRVPRSYKSRRINGKIWRIRISCQSCRVIINSIAWVAWGERNYPQLLCQGYVTSVSVAVETSYTASPVRDKHPGPILWIEKRGWQNNQDFLHWKVQARTNKSCRPNSDILGLAWTNRLPPLDYGGGGGGEVPPFLVFDFQVQVLDPCLTTPQE